MKKIVILGAGVTGLSLGQMLKDKAEVLILERHNHIGGIAATRKKEGGTYHTVGGHCFNSKYPEVMKFVFSILQENQRHKTQRLSRINFGEYEVDYPVEFSIKQIFEKDPDFAFKATVDFMSSAEKGSYSNLADWFAGKFGEELCNRYFLPYNTKIWAKIRLKWIINGFRINCQFQTKGPFSMH